MPIETDPTLTAAVQNWLVRFESALAASEPAAPADLFLPDSYWRDLLALTWDIGTIGEAGAIALKLRECAGSARPIRFEIDPGRTAPRRVRRAGTPAIEAFFRFETTWGRANGVLRLTGDDGGREPKAWTLLTALDSMTGHEERVGRSRPTGQSYARDFRGPNWLDRRTAAAAYTDRDPVVLVVGGGQAGLSIAARLTVLHVDTLVIDRWPRIGDNWRQRYHALTLHNQVHVNHLPYMPFPPSWPTYIPKDKLAGWLEAYVESLEIDYWPATELVGGSYDEAEGRWSVVLRRADGTTRRMHPRHVVMATGVSGIPSLPDLPGLRTFAGTVQHSSQYGDGEMWAGRSAIVVGTGNSGHDIAQDLHSSGARVAIVQRSPTQVVNIEPSAQLPYALYDEGPPLEDCDLLAASMPLPLARRTHQALTAQSRELDKALLDGLERVGFKLDYGEDGTGWQFKYLTRGGGYYFNVGCSDLIVERKIRLLQFADIAEIGAYGAHLKSGETIAADLIVLATGYKSQEHLIAKLFGETVAARVGSIWGFGEGMELRNMFARTAQPGLWFIAGSLAQCRIYSKYLALQIKACEAGLFGVDRCRPNTGFRQPSVTNRFGGGGVEARGSEGGNPSLPCPGGQQLQADGTGSESSPQHPCKTPTMVAMDLSPIE